MATSSFTARLSVVVAYTDNSVGSFSSVMDGKIQGDVQDVSAWEDFISTFDATRFLDFLVQVFEQGTPVGTLSVTGIPAVTKTVDTAVVHISGQVADDDNSVSSFDVEILTDGTIVNHGGAAAGGQAVADLISVETFRAIMESIFIILAPNSTTSLTVA